MSRLNSSIRNLAWRACAVACLHVIWGTDGTAMAAPADGELEILIVDRDRQQPVPARIHLRDGRGRPVRPRGWGIAPLDDHVYIDGSSTLKLGRGQYEFDLDAGPEYRPQSGNFEIVRHASDSKTIEVQRVVKLFEEGWYAGDLDVRRSSDDLPIAMRAEQLAYVPTTAWDGNAAGQWKQAVPTRRRAGSEQSEIADSVCGPFAGMWSSLGNRLLFVRERTPFEPAEVPGSATSVGVIQLMRGAEETHAVAVSPFERSFPIWLASGELDAVLLLNRHSLQSGVVDNEADGHARDSTLFPGKSGNGRWAESIYHHALNTGLRIPPAAGSGSGANGNPVGTNRVYVHCGPECDVESWWHGLAAGNVVVTNGPLLRPMVEGRPPGYVFRIDTDQTLELPIALNLATRTPISYLEIVKNGVVDRQVEIASLVKAGGKLPPVTFDESGWFLVRAVASRGDKYELASTGPYYVEKNGQPRISRRSVQFFLDWLDDEEARATPPERPAFATARAFWQERLAKANAE